MVKECLKKKTISLINRCRTLCHYCGYVSLIIFLGGFGIDFSQSKSITSNDVERVAKGILAHGVTSFCPTLVTSPVEIYDKVTVDMNINSNNTNF